MGAIIQPSIAPVAANSTSGWRRIRAMRKVLRGSTLALVAALAWLAVQIPAAAQFTVIHNFGSGPEGSGPSLLLRVGSTFYGGTQSGGANDYGTIFAMDLA